MERAHLFLLLLSPLLSPSLGQSAADADAGLEREDRASDRNSTVCYDYVGCFDHSSPFNNTNELPQDPDFVNTTFMLYTRSNPGVQDYEVLSYENDTLLTDSLFDPKRMTRVITHGFTNSGFEKWVQAMKDAFLQIEDSNVIVVHWENGAVMPLYPSAVANTRLIGKQLYLLLLKLVEEEGLQLNRVHLIGHSLGAHVSGYTGRDLKGQLYRITAMDPAGPLFDAFSATLDLDKTDAMFVDVIHSNGKPIEDGGAGLYKQIGHVDFYINGGKTQPGCRDGLGALLNIFKQNIGDAVSCSHSRSHEVFLESITSDCPFTAYPCHSFEGFVQGQCLDCGERGCSELGLYADQHRARGLMYLKTRDQSPYCGFHYSVTIETAGNAQDTSGQLSVKLRGSWGTSDLVSVTEEKEDLKSGTAYGGVVVAATEVGIIQTLTIRYDKASGFLWIFGGGRNSFQVDKVRVVSGESGRTYTFCLRGKEKELVHAKEVTLTPQDDNEC